MLKLFSIGILIFFFSNALFVQNINLGNDNFYFSTKNIKSEKATQIITQTSFYDLTKLLPQGFVTDGSKDYTKFIQKGIDENTNVLIPNFPILINEKGLIAKSNSQIVFQKNSRLLMKPNSLENYAILKIYNVSNVVISSPVIIGERNQHKGNKGEWGFGLQITAAKNIKIISPMISNCWGDGIYIGGDELNTCDSIIIINANINSCRRNGISITDGKNIQIIKPIISNTNGTSPMAGIDIEPNTDNATIDNILISNPITINNARAGILIALNNLPSKSVKYVRIKIENHIDKQSFIAFWMTSVGIRGDFTNKVSLSGSIEVNNPKWYNNKQTLESEIIDFGPKTTFKNIQIYKDEMSTKNKLFPQEVVKVKKEQSRNKNISIE